MIPVQFGGKKCLDPAAIRLQCVESDPPVPLDWWGLANRFYNPLGTESGTGHVLMQRRDLDALDLEKPQDLIFTCPWGEAKLLKLHMAGPTLCLTPHVKNAGDECHLVKLADCRRRLRLAVANVGFNLRVTPTGNYLSSTATSNTVPYSWAEIWSQLWPLLPADHAGTTPSLPTTPDATPEGFDFYGWPVMKAIGHFLDRLGYGLALDLTARSAWFSVVKLGDAQTGLKTEEQRLQQMKAWIDDRQPVVNYFGQVPQDVKVYFRREPTAAYGFSQFHVVTVANDEVSDDDIAKGQEGTVRLFDDLAAKYQAGELTNEDALQTRAESRATEFFRQRWDFLTVPQRRTYSGFFTKVKPGSEIESVTWQDVGDGPKTTTARLPQRDSTAEWPGNMEKPYKLVEWVWISDEGAPAGYFGAITIWWNAHTDEWENEFRVWVHAANNETLVPGGKYMARFEGFKESGGSGSGAYGGRPVYGTFCCPTGSGLLLPPAEDDNPTISDGPPGEGGIATPCCPSKKIPPTLYATFTGACGLGGLVVPLHWHTAAGIGTYNGDWALACGPVDVPVGNLWIGTTTVSCSSATRVCVEFYCDTATNKLAIIWRILYAGGICPFILDPDQTASSYACDPISATLTYFIAETTHCDCCNGALVTVTVTE